MHGILDIGNVCTHVHLCPEVDAQTYMKLKGLLLVSLQHIE